MGFLKKLATFLQDGFCEAFVEDTPEFLYFAEMGAHVAAHQVLEEKEMAQSQKKTMALKKPANAKAVATVPKGKKSLSQTTKKKTHGSQWKQLNIVLNKPKLRHKVLRALRNEEKKANKKMDSKNFASRAYHVMDKAGNRPGAQKVHAFCFEFAKNMSQDAD